MLRHSRKHTSSGGTSDTQRRRVLDIMANAPMATFAGDRDDLPANVSPAV